MVSKNLLRVLMCVVMVIGLAIATAPAQATDGWGDDGEWWEDDDGWGEDDSSTSEQECEEELNDGYKPSDMTVASCSVSVSAAAATCSTGVGCPAGIGTAAVSCGASYATDVAIEYAEDTNACTSHWISEGGYDYGTDEDLGDDHWDDDDDDADE